MPNEQVKVPLFAAAEILTAANMNISAGTGVPVFTNSTTRDAAFGGAGEKVLAEGQLCYLSDSNIVQYYTGAAWATVGPTTAGLVCVKAETALSGSSTFADGVFTSTYTNYRIVIRYQTSTSAELAMQLRAATVDTATGYNYQTFQADSTSLAGSRSASQTSAFVGKDPGAFTSLTTLELSGPQLAEPTVYQAVNTRNNGAYTVPWVVQYFGNQSGSTQFDGIKFLVASGTMSGSYTIYGYSKTV
jgi:hypothetical protein